MKKRAARLVNLMNDIVEIDKARHAQLAGELANTSACYEAAVDAMSNPQGCLPPSWAAVYCRSMEVRLQDLSQACMAAEQKLLDDGRQLKLFEARELIGRQQEMAEQEREQQASIIERFTSDSLR